MCVCVCVHACACACVCVCVLMCWGDQQRVLYGEIKTEFVKYLVQWYLLISVITDSKPHFVFKFITGSHAETG